MSDKLNHDESADSDVIAKLLQIAGERPSAPPERKSRVYEAARASWEQTSSSNRLRHRLTPWLAAAASIGAIALIVSLVNNPPPTTPVPRDAIVASLDYVDGDVLFLSYDGLEQWLHTSSSPSLDFRVGDALRTAGGARAAIRFKDETSLRINEDSMIVLEAPDHVSIDEGLIYLDTGRENTSGVAVRVSTPLGAVWHVGTQFELLVGAEQLRIRVREGEVAFSDSDRELRSRSGEELRIPDTGVHERSFISATDAAWDWVTELAIVEDDEYRLHTLLSWIGRELGREIQFASPAADAHARTLLVHGVQGQTPLAALEILRTVTRLRYELTAHVIRVSELPR